VEKAIANGVVPKANRKGAVASAQPTKTVEPQKRKRDTQEIKEESAPPDKKKKAAAIKSMSRRICELESESIDMDD
jgi:hypothetical protein